MCVCEDLASLESIDLKLIPVCLINNYSLIADLHIFVFGRAEGASFQLYKSETDNFYLRFCFFGIQCSSK